MRALFKWLTWFVVLLSIFIGVAYFTARYFEAPVKQYFVKQLNNRLKSPVHVEEIDFSLLTRFPSASLVLKNVWAEENVITIGQADTLAAFERLYLNFNIFDLINGDYRLRGVEGSNGVLKFSVDERGEDNFHIWKTTSDTTGFLLELDRVSLNDVALRYTNALRQQDYSLKVNDLVFRGSFSEEEYTMQVEGDGGVHHLIVKGENYLDRREVAVETELDVTTQTSEYAFRNGQVLIDDQLKFSVEGKVGDAGVNLRMKGYQLDIVEALSLIPSEDRKLLNDYESEGILNFDCSIIGAFDRTENPAFHADFSFSEAVIEQKGSGLRLANLVGRGSIDNGASKSQRSVVLILDTLSGVIGEGTFHTGFSIRNFEKPEVEGRIRFDSKLEELRQLLKLDRIEETAGEIRVDARIKTRLQQLDSIRSSDFINANASGTIHLSNALLKLKDDVRTYEVDSGNASIKNNNLLIHACRGRLNGAEVNLTGEAESFLAYIFSNTATLAITGNVGAGDIRLEDFFASRESEGGSAVVAFPDRITINANLKARSFEYGKFKATEVSGRLLMDSFKVQADQLSFNSQDGSVIGKAGIYRFAENQFGFRSEFSVEDIDTRMLFSTFNNFGQQFLRDDHLSGRANADIAVQAFCDSLFQINTNSITANAELQIINGRLTGFQPLVDVAEHVRKKRMMRLFIDTEELKNRLNDVAFDTLENIITIRDQRISIPSMTIRSSAIDMAAEGNHTFNNEIDYSLDFALSELLTLEDRKEPYNEFVRRDAKGQTRIFMRISGTTDDPEVSVERTNVAAVVRKDLDEERETVKSLLKSEFGAFSNDTSIREVEAPAPEVIGLEFDPETDIEKQENESHTSPTVKKDSVEAKDRNILNRFMKKTEADKKKLREGEFEDDDF